MKLIDRLFGRRSDPTLNWVQSTAPIPQFNLNSMQFGSLHFGDPLEAAASLGRPDQFVWSQGEYCELLYASRGFQVDFDRGKLSYVAFFIGPDEFVPAHTAFQFSKPRVHGVAIDGIELSPGADRALIERLLGSADSVDVDAREVILFYNRGGITMEFELDAKTGGLKRWNLYPTLPT
jgi:hypothetical protein